MLAPTCALTPPVVRILQRPSANRLEIENWEFLGSRGARQRGGQYCLPDVRVGTKDLVNAQMLVEGGHGLVLRALPSRAYADLDRINVGED